MAVKTLIVIFILTSGFGAAAGDWPLWGGRPSRNMASPEENIPYELKMGTFDESTDELDLSASQNIRWAAKLGSLAYGNVTIANGKVFVGTNNESPRDPRRIGDRGVLLCLDEATGDFLWQLAVPKLENKKDQSDLEYLGICSSPTLDGNRVYAVTNRCEVVCLDAAGLMDGNDGPFQDEGTYMAEPGTPPLKLGKTDADILWRFDMRKQLGVFPHNITSSSILLVGNRLFVTTSNGRDWTHQNIPSPSAPCLIALDKNTGELLGVETSGISQRLMHCNWSSPSYGEIDGKGMVVFGAGDGFCYGFDPSPVKREDEVNVLRELWRFDCVPGAYKKNKYSLPEGPSEIISTPVFYDNRVYVSIGQDPEHGDGLGNFVCIDPSKRGDITQSGAVWSYQKIARSISTPSIGNGLVFVSDFTGYVHCLDAQTGEAYWVYDTQSRIWGSTLLVDGKIFIGNEDGFITVLAADKTQKVLNSIDMGAPVYSTPVAANGVLYISTQTHLFAVKSPS